jgi:hypothetical protein
VVCISQGVADRVGIAYFRAAGVRCGIVFIVGQPHQYRHVLTIVLAVVVGHRHWNSIRLTYWAVAAIKHCNCLSHWYGHRYAFSIRHGGWVSVNIGHTVCDRVGFAAAV